jgi:lysyl-tRNA synthetase class 2
MVPMGAYDLEKVDGDIVIRLSKENETFLGIGDTTLLIAHPGVVVYTHDGGIICWAWNHRDAARVALSPTTNRAIFFADSSSHESESRAAAAIARLAEAISGAVERNSFVLNRANSTATV